MLTSVVLMCIPGTQCFGAGMFMAGIKGAISGAVIGGMIGGIVSAINGNGFWNGVVQGLASGILDGFIAGALLYCASQAISAVVNAANERTAKPSNCFIAGTLVLCENGYKAIEDIQVGDKVLAYDEKTRDTTYKRVRQIFRNTTDCWYNIEAAGERITCTAEHPFYVVGKGFVFAQNLKTNDKLLLSSGKNVIIENIEIEHLYEPETTYNFEVEDYHTYFVTEKGILVHNDCITDELTKIAENYNKKLQNTSLSDQQRLLCVDAADEMQGFLRNKGLSGARVEVRTNVSNQFIVSDTFGINAISTNGYHVGIQYKSLVFDNIHTRGINYSLWKADFASRYGLYFPSPKPF